MRKFMPIFIMAVIYLFFPPFLMAGWDDPEWDPYRTEAVTKPYTAGAITIRPISMDDRDKIFNMWQVVDTWEEGPKQDAERDYCVNTRLPRYIDRHAHNLLSWVSVFHKDQFAGIVVGHRYSDFEDGKQKAKDIPAISVPVPDAEDSPPLLTYCPTQARGAVEIGACFLPEFQGHKVPATLPGLPEEVSIAHLATQLYIDNMVAHVPGAHHIFWPVRPDNEKSIAFATKKLGMQRLGRRNDNAFTQPRDIYVRYI